MITVTLLHDERTIKENSLNSLNHALPGLLAKQQGRVLLGFFFSKCIQRDKTGKGLRENLIEMIFRFPKEFYQNEIYFVVGCFHSICFSTDMDGETCCKKSQTPGIYLSPCVKVYPSTISAEFKITANRLTTVFLLLQMKNIRKLGEYSASQFVLTAHCYLQCLFDRTDILYRCEMGKRVTFLFMVAYALVMISPGRCAYCSSPEPSENKQEPKVPAVRLPY